MCNVMIVEDEAIIALQLEERLSAIGYNVVGNASNGHEAVTMAKKLNPSIILMDIVMPGKVDGIQASNMIKKELDIPIIFLTAYSDSQYVDMAKTTEPYGYIVKPYKEEEIKASIEIAIFKKKMERRLKESEKKYRSVVSAASEAIITINSEILIQTWNEAAQDIFGYSSEEVKGKKLSILMPEILGKEFQKKLSRMIETGLSDSLGKQIEGWGLTKDGTAFPIEYSLSNWEYNNEIYFTIITHAITERTHLESQIKEIKREKDVLAHQVKEGMLGNISLVESLTNLYTKYRSAKKINSLLGRIRILKYIQDYIYNSENIRKISLNEFVKHVLILLDHKYKLDENNIKINFKIERIEANVDRFTKLGLILYELVENSIIHAFPENKGGEINIECTRESNDLVLLTVSDNGVGFFDESFENTKGIGLKWVAVLVSQLDGIIKKKAQDGTTYVIALK